jgi:hypothetical protein
MPRDYAVPITVLRGHLQEIADAVDTAYGYHTADDLARQYKNVGSTHRPSNLTVRLEKALSSLEGYLAQEETDESGQQD